MLLMEVLTVDKLPVKVRIVDLDESVKERAIVELVEINFNWGLLVFPNGLKAWTHKFDYEVLKDGK